MLRGYRGIVCALIGLTLWSQAPRAQGVPGPSPTPNEQPTKAAQAGNGKPKPLAVTIVESPEQAEAGKRRVAQSDSQEASDLDTQIRAADAAEKQVFPAWLAAILSFAGTVLIVWTLYLTRLANQIALESRRPWLSIGDPEIELVAHNLHDGIFVEILIQTKVINSGGFPAFNVRGFAGKSLVIGQEVQDEERFVSECLGNRGHKGRNVAPNGDHTFDLRESVQAADGVAMNAHSTLPANWLFLAFTYQINPAEGSEMHITSQAYLFGRSANATGIMGFPLKEIIEGTKLGHGTAAGVKAEAAPCLNARMT